LQNGPLVSTMTKEIRLWM